MRRRQGHSCNFEVYMKNVDIYTDGACTGNPGKGGYGAILIYGEHKKEISCGFRKTTNNRMELMAPITALGLLNERCSVTVYSDSKYLTDAINKKWLDSWKRNNWKKADRKAVLNVDLWQRLDRLIEFHDVEFVWVKGHDGNQYNELCDALAVNAYSKEELDIDKVYENAN